MRIPSNSMVSFLIIIEDGVSSYDFEAQDGIS